MQNRSWKLLGIAAAASIVASCAPSDAQESPISSKGKVSEKYIKTILAGQNISVDDQITLSADDRTPIVLLKQTGSTESPQEIEVSKETSIWHKNKVTKFRLLGLRKDIESNSRAYAVQIETVPSSPPKIASAASGTYSWNFNNPTSLRDGNTIDVISMNPLLVIGSNSRMGNDEELSIVTNFGTKTFNAKKLRPGAIKFQKKSGELLTCPWKESISYYDIPNSARGHGIIKGPMPGTSTCETSIGPARIVFSRTYPGRGLTNVSLKVAPGAVHKGPYVLSYTLPDFYSASLGMPTYIQPHSQPPIKYARHAAHDTDFRETWTLELTPPIMVEYGLGPNGVAQGAARITCRLWKFGNNLYGSGGYTYSDCGLHGGGSIEGTIKNGSLNLKLTGQPNMTLTSTSVSGDEIRGTAKILGQIPGGGFSPQSTSAAHTFLMKASSTSDEGTFTRSSSESHSKGKYSDLERLCANKDYWDALTVTPGTQYRDSLALETERLIITESQAGTSLYALESRMNSLAHMQYCAWLSNKSSLGLNHPITVANGKVAQVLYKRILQKNQSGSDPSNDTVRKHLSEILNASNQITN